MSFLSALRCKFFGAHKFHRARKGQDPSLKYCSRCDMKAQVKPRKRKANGGAQ